MKETKKEGSTLAGGNVTGFAAPFGSRMVKRKRGGKKNNVSKPYGEAALFESIVAMAVLNNESIEEVVRKMGSKWAVIDDDTGATRGMYDKRSLAWEKQRTMRRQKGQTVTTDKSKTDKPPKAKSKAKKAPKAKTSKQPKSTSEKSKVKKENTLKRLKEKFAAVLKESSTISYVFEQGPANPDSVLWEKFISRLSKETVLADPKFKAILKNVAKSEVKALDSAVNALSQVLGATGQFEVEKANADQDEHGDVVLNFGVKLADGPKLKFGVKVENGRPLLMFPEESRNALNSMGTDASKLLRAEMMHVQETVFDEISDVSRATDKRNMYLKSLEAKVDKLIDQMGLLEVAMVRHLLKNKYKGIK